MPTLGDLQVDFVRAVTDPEAARPADVVCPLGGAGDKRFNVYRNNVIASLGEALAATYPAIVSLLGETYFKALAPVYVRAHPPQSPVLMTYGEGFAEFLEAFPPLADWPYLGDVARIEWAWLRAYHAEDVSPLPASRLGALPPAELAELALAPHPAAAVLTSCHASLSLFLANRPEGGGVAQPGPAELACGQSVLVTRPGMEVELRRLPPGAATFLAALMAGDCLGNAAEAGAEAAAQSGTDFDLAASLATMLEAGAFRTLQARPAGF